MSKINVMSDWMRALNHIRWCGNHNKEIEDIIFEDLDRKQNVVIDNINDFMVAAKDYHKADDLVEVAGPYKWVVLDWITYARRFSSLVELYNKNKGNIGKFGIQIDMTIILRDIYELSECIDRAKDVSEYKDIILDRIVNYFDIVDDNYAFELIDLDDICYDEYDWDDMNDHVTKVLAAMSYMLCNIEYMELSFEFCMALAFIASRLEIVRYIGIYEFGNRSYEDKIDVSDYSRKDTNTLTRMTDWIDIISSGLSKCVKTGTMYEMRNEMGPRNYVIIDDLDAFMSIIEVFESTNSKACEDAKKHMINAIDKEHRWVVDDWFIWVDNFKHLIKEWNEVKEHLDQDSGIIFDWYKFIDGFDAKEIEEFKNIMKTPYANMEIGRYLGKFTKCLYEEDMTIPAKYNHIGNEMDEDEYPVVSILDMPVDKYVLDDIKVKWTPEDLLFIKNSIMHYNMLDTRVSGFTQKLILAFLCTKIDLAIKYGSPIFWSYPVICEAEYNPLETAIKRLENTIHERTDDYLVITNDRIFDIIRKVKGFDISNIKSDTDIKDEDTAICILFTSKNVDEKYNNLVKPIFTDDLNPEQIRILLEIMDEYKEKTKITPWTEFIFNLVREYKIIYELRTIDYCVSDIVDIITAKDVDLEKIASFVIKEGNQLFGFNVFSITKFGVADLEHESMGSKAVFELMDHIRTIHEVVVEDELVTLNNVNINKLITKFINLWFNLKDKYRSELDDELVKEIYEKCMQLSGVINEFSNR